jgi:hypothetical protein
MFSTASWRWYLHVMQTGQINMGRGGANVEWTPAAVVDALWVKTPLTPTVPSRPKKTQTG